MEEEKSNVHMQESRDDTSLPVARTLGLETQSSFAEDNNNGAGGNEPALYRTHTQ